jgi:hypothetical protein
MQRSTLQQVAAIQSVRLWVHGSKRSCGCIHRFAWWYRDDACLPCCTHATLRHVWGATGMLRALQETRKHDRTGDQHWSTLMYLRQGRGRTPCWPAGANVSVTQIFPASPRECAVSAQPEGLLSTLRPLTSGALNTCMQQGGGRGGRAARGVERVGVLGPRERAGVWMPARVHGAACRRRWGVGTAAAAVLMLVAACCGVRAPCAS